MLKTPITFLLLAAALCASSARAQSVEGGTLPQSGRIYNVETAFSGKCSPPAERPIDFDRGRDGLKYTGDETYSVFYRLLGRDASGGTEEEAGATMAGAISLDEAAGGVTRNCHNSGGRPLQFTTGRYRMDVLHHVLEQKWSNLGVWSTLKDEKEVVERVEFEVRKVCGQQTMKIARVTDERERDLTEAERQAAGIRQKEMFEGMRVVADRRIELQMEDGTQFRLEKGSSFEVDECSEFVAETDTLRYKLSMKHILGTIWYHLIKAAGTEYEVTNERACLGVRGTTFEVAADTEHESMTVRLAEGSLFFSSANSGEGVLLKPGQTAVQVGFDTPKIVGSKPAPVKAGARRGSP